MRIPLRIYLLVVLGLFAALPVLVLGFAQTKRSGEAQIEQTDQSNRFTAETVAQNLTQYLDLRAAELDGLAHEVESQPALDPATMQALIARRRVLSGHFTSIAVGDRSGTIVAAEPRLDSAGGPTVGRRAPTTQAYRGLLGGAVTLGWLESDPITTQPGLRLLAPAMTTSGTRLGYVDAMIDLRDLQQIIQQVIDWAPGMRVAVVDSRGVVLAATDSAPNAAPMTVDESPIDAPAGADATSRLAPNAHGKLIRAATAPITTRGLTWTAVAGLPELTVQTQASAVQRDTLILAGVSLIVALGIAALLAHTLAWPIRQLADAAAAIGRGDAPVALARFPRWYPSELRILTLEVGTMARRLLARHDVLEHEVAERTAELRASQTHFRSLIENGSDLITVVEADGTASYVSPSAEHVLGYPIPELLGQNALAHVHPEDAPWVQRSLLDRLADGRSGVPREFRIQHRDGSWRVLEAVAKRLPGSSRAVVNSHDITVRKRDEATLRRMALFDELRGLPNRTLLQDRLDQALRDADRSSRPVCVLLMDLDRFKDVNDTFGHLVGDTLLTDVGQRAAALLRASDTLARLGGDEFAVILPATDLAGAVAIARVLTSSLQQTFALAGHMLMIGASIGIAEHIRHETDVQELIRRADVAMYVSKREKSDYAVYTSDQDQHTADRLSLASDLRRALESGELELYYQPQVVVATGQPVGVEALLRWRRDDGWVSPETFIPVAEESDLINQLTRWVLDTALAQSQAWREDGLDVAVSVNLSMRDLLDPNLPDEVAALLAQHGVPPGRLELELTEGSLMVDPPRTLTVLNRLREMGIGISVDDFGTGYSSLAYLKRLPIDELKIDKVFISHLDLDENDAIIVRSTISLGHALGLRVVAEGIEDQVTWDHLVALGCDVAQGFLFARPLPASEATAYLHQAAQSSLPQAA